MKQIEKILEYLTVALLIFLVSIVTIQIFSRMFNYSFMWTEELARYVLVYLTFLGASLAYYKGEGLRIALLIDKFSPKLRKINDSMVLIFTLFVTIFVASMSILLVISLWESPTPALRWSKGMVTLIIPLGFTLTALRICKDLKKVIKA